MRWKQQSTITPPFKIHTVLGVDPETRRIIAAAALARPGQMTLWIKLTGGLLTWPYRHGLRSFRIALELEHIAKNEQVPDEAWEVQMVAVGLGVKLMQELLAGAPQRTFLTLTTQHPHGVKLYERVGFKLIRTIRKDGSGGSLVSKDRAFTSYHLVRQL